MKQVWDPPPLESPEPPQENTGRCSFWLFPNLGGPHSGSPDYKDPSIFATDLGPLFFGTPYVLVPEAP